MSALVPTCLLALTLVFLQGCQGQTPPPTTNGPPPPTTQGPPPPTGAPPGSTTVPTGQLGCTTDAECPVDFRCGASGLCEPEDFPTVVCSDDSDCPGDMECGMTFLCQPPGGNGEITDFTAYIIMGVVMAVIIIIVIIILVISCGRWTTLNWRMRYSSGHQRQAVRVGRTGRMSNMIRKIHRKPKLKLGVKRNNFATVNNPASDMSTGSKALFVMSDGNPQPVTEIDNQAMESTSLRPSAGPNVAVVDVDGPIRSSSMPRNSNRASTSNDMSANHEKASTAHMSSLPNMSLMHTAPAGLYPIIGQPQHQINIQAAVPLHQHAQVTAQPVGLYPNIGHTHAHVVTPGQAHSSMHLSPPAYQSMDRKY